MKTEVLPNLIPLFEILAVIIVVQQVSSGNFLQKLLVPNVFAADPSAATAHAGVPGELTVKVRPDGKLEVLDGSVVSFDEARSKEPAEDFVREVLVDALAARAVIVGEDFHFGHQRRGNVALLTAMGATLGFEVVGLPLVEVTGGPDGGETASSTAIRRALVLGDLSPAAAMLGRPHEVRGVVTHGDARGHELGFPTANVSVPGDILLPADGIYAGWYERPDGAKHPTAISLGRRPTFYEEAHASLLEAHLLDFVGDLYDESAKVRFVARLRGEVRFDNVDDLVAQMRRDCDDARAALA